MQENSRDPLKARFALTTHFIVQLAIAAKAAIANSQADELPLMNLNAMRTEGVCDRDLLGRRGLLLAAVPAC
jgi:hypothetical protein